jgi:hypothetical protein
VGMYTPGPTVSAVLLVAAPLGGSLDDAPAIQAKLNAANPGDTVRLRAAVYRTASSLTIPPFVTLEGPYAERDQQGSAFARIKPFNGFTGVAVIRLLDKEEGGYAVDNRGAKLRNISIDGSALTSTVLAGIRATGFVHGAIIENVSIYSVTGNGIETANYTRLDTTVQHPYSWVMDNVQVQVPAGIGVTFAGMSDIVATRCRVINAGSDGWVISGGANSTYTDCRAEWSAGRGFVITGSFGTGTGSGSARFALSTDRNGQDGVYVDATGNGALLFVSPMLRRDGRNGNAGGGSFAGIRGNGATIPILVTSPSVYPGVDDDGTGVNSPQYGASFTGCTFAELAGAGVLHANTAGFNDGGTNTVLRRGSEVVDRSGTTSSPGAINYPSTPMYQGVPFGSGQYEFPVSQDAASTSNTLGNQSETAVPFYWEPGTPAVTRVGVDVTAAGDVGCTVRLGVRADDPANRRPANSAPLADFGTVAGDAIATPEITGLSFTPGAPGWYWYTVTVQGAATTQPTLRTGTKPHPGYRHALGTSKPSAGTTVMGRKQTGVSGALPNTWTDGGTSGSVPRIWFKH